MWAYVVLCNKNHIISWLLYCTQYKSIDNTQLQIINTHNNISIYLTKFNLSLEINKILIKIEKILIQKQNKQNTQFCSDLNHDSNQNICIKQPWNTLTAPAVCASERQDLPFNTEPNRISC